MEWLGWVCAVLAIAVAVWAWRRLAAERAQASEVLYEKIDAETRVDALLAEQAAVADTAPLFISVADRLDGALLSTRMQIERAALDFADYREHVKRFDSAVQYCLQPVEMIFGADKATLDQLVHHVEGARRKLFDARSLLEKHALHVTPDVLDGVLDEVRALSAVSDDVRAGKFAPSVGADAVDATPAPTAPTALTP